MSITTRNIIKAIQNSGANFCTVNYIAQQLNVETVSVIRYMRKLPISVKGKFTKLAGYISVQCVQSAYKTKVSRELLQNSRKNVLLGKNELTTTQTGYTVCYGVS